MTTYQYCLVQCGCCGKWVILRGMAGKRIGVSLDDLVKAEALLNNECKVTHHRGRRIWKATSPKP